ncbi:Rhodanese-related sulfurtransferase [Halorientalis regularis]|jgi:rhodanese-related sulfurtransferase|uniref:Rhodanese-related sulfurtransferase n=1 Tax=Halorientalis regularis TaxID=660518 RepID=A0A1G7U5G5_9EURY|nr:rhodanese-like domain-containing protein [Halorientalis regularis]SDG42299.1 Rhodanese-related sulfurtransferase [Halorientalis regularis]
MSNTDIEAVEVARRLETDDAAELFVLDVRKERDYAQRRIPESTNVPVYEDLLQYDYSGLENHLDELPENEEIAVVCKAGVTSARAAEFLRAQGFEAKSVRNGMHAWGRVDHDMQ